MFFRDWIPWDEHHHEKTPSFGECVFFSKHPKQIQVYIRIYIYIYIHIASKLGLGYLVDLQLTTTKRLKNWRQKTYCGSKFWQNMSCLNIVFMAGQPTPRRKPNPAREGFHSRPYEQMVHKP